MSAIAIDTMKPVQLSEAATVIAQAMHTNPMNMAVWKYQGASDLGTQIALTKLVFEKTPLENMLVAMDDADIVGALRMNRSPSCQMSLGQSLALLPRLAAIQRRDTGRTLKWLSAWAKHDPDEPHWHLGPVGVLPERQGQQVGSRLMAKYLERADADGIGAYLETDKIENVGYYERFGFKTAGTDEVLGVTNWFMWRPAVESLAGAATGEADPNPATGD